MKGDTIKELLRKCNKVERLDVSLCPINDADVFALSPSNSSLRVLNLEAWCDIFSPLQATTPRYLHNPHSNITEKGLQHLCSIATSLEILNVANCTRLSGSSIEKVLTANKDRLQSLHTLNLDGIWTLNDTTIGNLLENVCPSVRYLNVAHSNGLSDRGLRFLSKLPLHSLAVGGCVFLTTRGLHALAASKFVRTPSLAHTTTRTTTTTVEDLWELSLDELPQLTDLCLSAILRGCKSLRSISLCGCDSVGSVAGEALLSLGAQLNEVHISKHTKLASYLDNTVTPSPTFTVLKR